MKSKFKLLGGMDAAVTKPKWSLQSKLRGLKSAGTLILIHIALITLIVFSFAACGDSPGGSPQKEDPPWRWETYSDSSDNTGNSTITKTEASGTLTFAGELKAGDPHPYAGFQAYPNADMLALLKTAVAITFDFYGDGRTYTLKLPTSDITDYTYYETTITPAADKWETITINVSELEQPDWAEDPKEFDQDLVQWIEWHITESTGTSGTSVTSGTSEPFNVSIKNLALVWSGGGEGTQDDPFHLYPDTWVNGSITPATTDEAVWYSFNAKSKTTYHIWWNDDDNASDMADIRMAVYYSDGSEIFDVDNIYTNYEYMNYQSFTSGSTGAVKIKVYPYWPVDSGYPRTGTFALLYSTGSVRPDSGRVGINLNIKQITDGAPVINDSITISQTGSPKIYPVTVSTPSAYSSIAWEVAGVGNYEGQSVPGSGATFTLDAGNVKYNSPGGHTLLLTVTKDGQQYQKVIPFTITN